MNKRIMTVLTGALLSLLISVSAFAATEKEEALEAAGYIPLTQADFDEASETESEKGIILGTHSNPNDKLTLKGAKYYLAEDISIAQPRIYWDGPQAGEDVDIALDLNGHDLTTIEKSMFFIAGKYRDEYYMNASYGSITLTDSEMTGVMRVGDGGGNENSYLLRIDAVGDCGVTLKDMHFEGRVSVTGTSDFPYSKVTMVDNCVSERRGGNKVNDHGFNCGGSARLKDSTFINGAYFTSLTKSESNILTVENGCTFGNIKLYDGEFGCTGSLYAEDYDLVTIGEEDGEDSDVTFIVANKKEGFFLRSDKVVLNHFNCGNSSTINTARIILLNYDKDNPNESLVMRSGNVYAPYSVGYYGATGEIGSFYSFTLELWKGGRSVPSEVIKDAADKLLTSYTGKVEVLENNQLILCSGKDKKSHFVIGRKGVSMNDNFNFGDAKPDPKDPEDPTDVKTLLKNCNFQWAEDVSAIYFDGTEKKIGFTLKKSDGTELKEGEDYSVEYLDPKDHSEGAEVKNAGIVKVKITAVSDSNYTGSLTKKYSIKPMVIADAASAGILVSSVDSDSEIVYSNKTADNKPLPEITLSGELLQKGRDYTLSYKNYSKAASADSGRKAPAVKVKGKGNYKGTWTINYSIVPQTLSANSIVVSAKDVVQTTKKGKWLSKVSIRYNDKNVKVKSTDFEVSYATISGNEITKDTPVSAGTTVVVTVKAKGGNFCDEIATTYRVCEKLITKAKVSLSDGVRLVYEETEVTPEMLEVIPSKNAEALTAGTEYTVKSYEYKTIKNKKYALITVKGLGQYGGEKLLKVRL